MRRYIEIGTDEKVSSVLLNMALFPEKIRNYFRLLYAKSSQEALFYRKPESELSEGLFEPGHLLSNGHWVIRRTERTAVRFDDLLKRAHTIFNSVRGKKKKKPSKKEKVKAKAKALKRAKKKKKGVKSVEELGFTEFGFRDETYWTEGECLPDFNKALDHIDLHWYVPVAEEMAVYFTDNSRTPPEVYLRPSTVDEFQVLNGFYILPLIAAGFELQIAETIDRKTWPLLAFEEGKVAAACMPYRGSNIRYLDETIAQWRAKDANRS